MTTTKQIGDRGESIAKDYLENQGYFILETNYRYQKSEVDIIALKENVLAFVEVKTRKQNTLTSPESSVDNKKQKLLISAAQAYVEQNDLDIESRFDIISVTYTEKESEVEHIREAFYPIIN